MISLYGQDDTWAWPAPVPMVRIPFTLCVHGILSTKRAETGEGQVPLGSSARQPGLSLHLAFMTPFFPGPVCGVLRQFLPGRLHQSGHMDVYQY